MVKVSLNFRTNYSENTQRYYNSITARRIDPLDGSTTWTSHGVSSSDDDLPF